MLIGGIYHFWKKSVNVGDAFEEGIRAKEKREDVPPAFLRLNTAGQDYGYGGIDRLPRGGVPRIGLRFPLIAL